MSKDLELSIVVPAYKAGDFIKAAILKKIEVLNSMNIEYQLILLIDGNDNKTLEQIKEFINNPKITVLVHEKNLGKGYSVREGMKLAKAKYIGYMDVDNDINPQIIKDMYLNLVGSKYNAIVPSKFADKSKSNYPKYRSVISKTYIYIVRTFFKLHLSDIQLGAKMYTAEFLENVLPFCKVNRFAFELEMLAIAAKLKVLKVKEIAVSVNLKTKSTIRIRDGLSLLYDTLKIYFRLLSIHAVSQEG